VCSVANIVLAIFIACLIREKVMDILNEIEKLLKTEHEKKESIRKSVSGLEEMSRKIEAVLQCIHHTPALDKSALSQQCWELFADVRRKYSNLTDLVGKNEYFLYVYLWQSVTSKLCFLASLVSYLEKGRIDTREKLASILGIHVSSDKGFHIPLEDYLCGLLYLATELSRWSVNCVAMGNFSQPIAICQFVGDIESGFRLLNLKNDFLRKKFDGLKYDVKRVEQVVYDLKIRNLVP